MELADTVSMFATETFADVFTPFTTFKGKLNPFAEVANSGAASQRRILETPVTETIPTSRVITSPAAEKFIIADVNIDFWNGAAIRYKYPILPVDTMGSVGTIAEVLASTQPDKSVYAYPYFVRRVSDETEMSDYFSGFEVSFPKTKNFVRGSVLKLGTKYYRLRTDTWTDGAGFHAAQAVLLENPVQVLLATPKAPTYDPTTDAYPAGVNVNVLSFVEPMAQDYEFDTAAFKDIKAGDKAISVLESAAVLKPNDTIGNYLVLSVRDYGTWRTIHGRPKS